MAWSGSNLVPYKIVFGTVLIFVRFTGHPYNISLRRPPPRKKLANFFVTSKMFWKLFHGLACHPFSFYRIVAFFDRSGTKHVTCFCETLDEKRGPAFSKKKKHQIHKTQGGRGMVLPLKEKKAAISSQ